MERHAQLLTFQFILWCRALSVHFFLSRAVLAYIFGTPRFILSIIKGTTFIMKNISLLTLLSASLVAAAPFVGTGPVVTAGTENVAIPSTQFGRREAAVQDFSKRALKLRGALLAARGGQGQGKGAGNADAETVVVDAQTQADDAAAQAKGKGKGKGKNANAQARMSYGEFHHTAFANHSTEQNAQDAAAGKLSFSHSFETTR